VTPWSNVTENRKRNAVAGGVGTGFVIDGALSDHPAVRVLGVTAGSAMLVSSAAIVKAFIDGNIERSIDPP
jgi:hypothetical protein